MTFAEYRRLPDDLLQHELVDGVHLAWPSPDIRHNRVKSELMVALNRQLEGSPDLLLLPGPFDLKLSEQDAVRPDLVVVRDPDGSVLEGEWLERLPDLVVEVLATDGVERDRRVKLPLYERVGVPGTWVVDPAKEVVEQYVLRDGAYVLIGSHGRELVSHGLPDVRIDLARVW